MIDTTGLRTQEFTIKKENKFTYVPHLNFSTGVVKSDYLFSNDGLFPVTIRRAMRAQDPKLIQDSQYELGDNYHFSECELIISPSLPKLLYMTNIFEITEQDYERIVSMIERSLDFVGANISRNNLDDFLLWRLDACLNIETELRTINYLDFLRQFDMNRMRKKDFSKKETETLLYHNTLREFTAYNKTKDFQDNDISKVKEIYEHLKDIDQIKAKQLENILQSNKNILRLESRKLETRSVQIALKKSIHKKNIKLIDVFNKNLMMSIVERDFNDLTKRAHQKRYIAQDSFSKLFIECERNLRDFYLALLAGNNQKLFDFLQSLNFEKSQVVNYFKNLGVKRRTAYNYYNELIDVYQKTRTESKINLDNKVYQELKDKIKIAAA